jgi:Flp pilus assembly protein TadD
MGELLMAVERNDEASPHLEEALRLRPQSVDFRISLGVLRARQGRLDEARRHFLAALALDPSSAVARANLQILQTMQGGAPSPAR